MPFAGWKLVWHWATVAARVIWWLSYSVSGEPAQMSREEASEQLDVPFEVGGQETAASPQLIA
ncbi:MAG: hypothetical protein ACKO9H_13220, partial [Planctomycetota bacterium]